MSKAETILQLLEQKDKWYVGLTKKHPALKTDPKVAIIFPSPKKVTDKTFPKLFKTIFGPFNTENEARAKAKEQKGYKISSQLFQTVELTAKKAGKPLPSF